MARHGLFLIAASLFCVIVATKEFEGYFFSSSSINGMKAVTIEDYGDTTMNMFSIQRLLQGKQPPISYNSLRPDYAPCMQGQAYMSNCKNNPTEVNPYKTDCTIYNHCERDTN